MIRTTFIYALKDPSTGDFKYIGKSDHPNVRISQHLRSAKGSKRNEKQAWINKLILAGKPPELIILEEVDAENWEDAERKWISIYRREGSLTNISEGGNAPPERQLEVVYDTNEAASLLGIGYATLYRWIKEGKLVPLRVGGHTLIPKSEIERLSNKKS